MAKTRKALHAVAHKILMTTNNTVFHKKAPFLSATHCASA